MSTPYCYMLEKLETRQILDPAQIPLHTAPQLSASIYSPGSTYLFSPSDSGAQVASPRSQHVTALNLVVNDRKTQ